MIGFTLFRLVVTARRGLEGGGGTWGFPCAIGARAKIRGGERV